jgi:imidazolonepropionase-like amidohydrolase
MRTLLRAGSLLLLSQLAAGQDLVIINARFIDGAGFMLENGSMVVRDGRIESISPIMANTRGMPTINAAGMTVMPGFIDAHRHIILGDTDDWFREQAEERLAEFLDAGFTTLMSGGGPVPGILRLKDRIDARELRGPRIITSGRVDPSTYPTPELARARVRELAELGVQTIKARIELEDEALLAVIAEEARAYDLDVMVHAVTVPAMHAAITAGAAKLVHTPHDSFMTADDARRVADAGVENLSTVGFAVPVFGVFNDDNVPTFRDGSAWPGGILGTGSNAAGEKVVNGRTLWDAGVVYGFGTDTAYHPRDGLTHELRALSLMFSPRDIIELMGPNTAAFVDMPADLGTLEPGKIADLVVIDGDPLNMIYDLLNVEIVVMNGEVVVDKR